MIKKMLPPAYSLIAILLILVLHFSYPGAEIIPAPWNLFGLVPLGFGIWINLAADQAFRRVQTTAKPSEEPSTLLTGGVYGISRHPMYLGFVATLMGIAILLGTLTPYLITIAFAILMDVTVIRAEEQNLEDKFGEDWWEYKRSVRRWI
ncbi:MAG: isoprenylcysteine carboxylmethyltransferase family protein [Anaerolineae bacterium]|nr:isoprenylcysteine carboxylmethyltransferase family protein [Anaerolineae bacterium]